MHFLLSVSKFVKTAVRCAVDLPIECVQSAAAGLLSTRRVPQASCLQSVVAHCRRTERRRDAGGWLMASCLFVIRCNSVSGLGVGSCDDRQHNDGKGADGSTLHWSEHFSLSLSKYRSSHLLARFSK